MPLLYAKKGLYNANVAPDCNIQVTAKAHIVPPRKAMRTPVMKLLAMDVLPSIVFSFLLNTSLHINLKPALGTG